MTQQPALAAGHFQSQSSRWGAGIQAGKSLADGRATALDRAVLLTHGCAPDTVAARAGLTCSRPLAVPFAHRQKENQWLKS